MGEDKGKRNWFRLLLIIVSGETVFLLPFVLQRVFRPTFLGAFELTNSQLGYCFSVYGIVAAISYLFGGFLADRFPPGKLIGFSLLLTAAGGFVMTTYPSYTVLQIIYGYWGFTTIFLFWAALIKATRIWGGTTQQTKAFGFLDGGRGLIAASIGLGGVFLFSQGIGGEDVASSEERQLAFRPVLIASSSFVAAIGVIILSVFREKAAGSAQHTFAFTRDKLLPTLRAGKLWLLMVIILCGYSGYKITENFSLYAHEILLYSEAESAGIGTFLLLFRPLVGFSLAFVANRKKPSLFLVFGFGFMLIGSAVLASGIVTPSLVWLFFFSTFLLSLGIFAARVLYFALIEEGRFPVALTGTVVGIVSIVGFAPDIFIGPIVGFFLDDFDGIVGHQLTFGLISLFALVGGICTYVFNKISDTSLLRAS